MARKKIGIKDKKLYLNFVYLADEEYSWLVENLGQAATDSWIEELNGALGQHGYDYASHYWTIRNWSRKKAAAVKPKDDGRGTRDAGADAQRAADRVIEALRDPANKYRPDFDERTKLAIHSVCLKRKTVWPDLHEMRHDTTYMEEIHAAIVAEYGVDADRRG
jgi:hypothetical protein